MVNISVFCEVRVMDVKTGGFAYVCGGKNGGSILIMPVHASDPKDPPIFNK